MKTTFKKIAFFSLCLVALNVQKLCAMQDKTLLNQRLLCCCEQKKESFKFDCFKALIDQGANIKTQNKHGSNLLHITAYNGHIEALKYLLEKKELDSKLNVNDVDCSYHVPLHYACTIGHVNVNIIKLLLEHGARTDIANNQGVLPLHMATESGHADAVDILIKKGKADVNAICNNPRNRISCTALHFATKKGNTGVTKCLLHNNAKIINGTITIAGQNNFMTISCDPAILAVFLDNIDALKCLVEYGDPSIESIEKCQEIALHHDKNDIIAYLEKVSEYKTAGTIVELKEEKIDTPNYLPLAIAKKDIPTINTLAKQYKELNASPRLLKDCFALAQRCKDIEIFKELTWLKQTVAPNIPLKFKADYVVKLQKNIYKKTDTNTFTDVLVLSNK